MLADGTRIQLLWALIDRELSVNELAGEVGKLPASVSQHLAKLRMSRLVRTRREGTQIYYRLENEHIARLVTDALDNADHASAGIPEHHRADAGVRRLTQPTSATGTDRP
jgi:DNA-binding transcriptional ArsR family regulator